MSFTTITHKLDRFSAFHYLPFVTLLDTWKVSVPDFQRVCCEERVDHFLQHMLNVLYEYNEILNLNPINVVRLPDNKYLIVDGQHRFFAYKRLLDEYDMEEHSHFCISVIVRDCDTVDEMKHYFAVLNNHFITTELITDVVKMEPALELKAYLIQRYDKFFSTKEKPRFPHVNIDSFVAYVLERYPSNTLIILEEMNQNIEVALCIADPERHARILMRGKLFMVHAYHMFKSKHRSSLPASVRRALWERYFPTDLEGNCEVCQTRISFHEFHAGHRVSSLKGGGDNIDNLACVCCSCNYSMGTMDMKVFKEKYF